MNKAIQAIIIVIGLFLTFGIAIDTGDVDTTSEKSSADISMEKVVEDALAADGIASVASISDGDVLTIQIDTNGLNSADIHFLIEQLTITMKNYTGGSAFVYMYDENTIYKGKGIYSESLHTLDIELE